MTVLIAFATVEGQTAKIARFVGKIAKEAGFNTNLVNTDKMSDRVSLGDVVKVILLAPVHERRHPESFEAFISSHRDTLEKRKSLVLSVGLKAAFASGREEARDYLTEMLLRTGFQPDATALIAGAVRPENYGYFEREILRHVVLLGRKIDPRDGAREFTDWEELTSIVLDFLSEKGQADQHQSQVKS
ncbi:MULTISPECIES: flavodoxin domain-containing protein [unclassified Ruegeria]|uniref:flavodoxin domain-containing protein n=1 Tax=unclassified Ruegeria TaxID=2625375 RepID=UPI00148841F4|nr:MULTISPECIES: flavodoxin domain-containing protein [unclassified Ruegeria]NOD45725.1 protoporphyrinogen oxidase [Ruegeria sp. HKCCD5849]NOD50975.1 protoporphyrinogen oxidase [Ruegeria sp. HKCCD5851]NOD67782.1 protoporphyrinogen oxidase [Ruegeria sp. HKCCD7303]